MKLLYVCECVLCNLNRPKGLHWPKLAEVFNSEYHSSSLEKVTKLL